MKGFKATNKMKCLDLTYEVGKTYTIDSFEICSHGFHFCQKMRDVIGYYEYSPDFILLEVEALGETHTDFDKTVTDKIKVLRIVPPEEYDFKIDRQEYDERGNQIANYGRLGISWWKKTYDAGNNVTHYIDHNNFQYFKTYDERGNELTHSNLSGNRYTRSYDEKDRLILTIGNGGFQEKRTYSEDGKSIHVEVVYFGTTDEEPDEEWITLDDKGRQLHSKDSGGFEEWQEYDENGFCTYYKTSDGEEWSKTFDEKGNCIFFEDIGAGGFEWHITIE